MTESLHRLHPGLVIRISLAIKNSSSEVEWSVAWNMRWCARGVVKAGYVNALLNRWNGDELAEWIYRVCSSPSGPSDVCQTGVRIVSYFEKCLRILVFSGKSTGSPQGVADKKTWFPFEKKKKTEQPWLPRAPYWRAPAPIENQTHEWLFLSAMFFKLPILSH